MTKADLEGYLGTIDRHLRHKALITIYGSCAFMLMDETGRTSLDLDIAGPYSVADYHDFRKAAAKAGLPVNPGPEDSDGDHIEWVSAGRLCLAMPDAASEMVLWRGRKLTVRTVSPAQLVASKLIRYDTTDQCDIRFLCERLNVRFSDIRKAVSELPPEFKNDAVVLDNLMNLKADMKRFQRRTS